MHTYMHTYMHIYIQTQNDNVEDILCYRELHTSFILWLRMCVYVYEYARVTYETPRHVDIFFP